MGWTDIFKSRSSQTRPDGRVHWFGKLPTYPDYYASPGDDDWCLEFNDWVLKGFEVYRSRSAMAELKRSLLPLGGCVVHLPASQMTVLAAILDYGGDMRGRPFPMCFYVGVPTSMVLGTTVGQSVGVLGVLDRLLDMRRDVSRFVNSPGKFEHTFGNREVDVSWVGEDDRDDSWMREAREIGFGDWFDVVRAGVKTKDQGVWLAQVSRRGKGISSLASDSFEATLRFPVAGGWPISVQVAGWLAWLDSRVGLDKRVCSMFLSDGWDGGVGWMGLAIRSLLEEDFLLMTPAGKMLNYVDDVDAGSGDGVGGEMGKVPERWIDFVMGSDNSA